MYDDLYFSIYSCLIKMRGNFDSAIPVRKADMFWCLHIKWCMLYRTVYTRFVNLS